MKHIILIVLFTSALFSQDVLKLKNGKVHEGKYFGEQNGIIVFKIKGESSTLTFNAEEVESVGIGNESIFYGNKKSMLYHRDNVKHLPSEENTDTFSKIDNAESSGYRPCAACFDLRPALDDYYLEKSLVQGVNGSIRTRWEIEYDHPRLDEVEVALKSLLDNWTETLKGYKYRIQLIVDEDPNAFAVAGGNIYLSTGLLDMIEDKFELEFVLAHEIAHVERRHTLREFKIQQKKALQGALMSAILGVGVYAAGGDAQTIAAATTISTMMIEFSNVYVMKGYGRELEQEADIFAQLQFLSKDISKNKMIYIFDKLVNHAKTMGNSLAVNAFSDHPSLRARMLQIKFSKFHVLEEPKNILVVPKGEGYNSNPLVKISSEVIYVCPSSIGGAVITLLGKISNPNKDKSYRIDKLTIKSKSLDNKVSLENLIGTSIAKDSEIDFATTFNVTHGQVDGFIEAFKELKIKPEANLSVVTIKRGEGSKKNRNTYLEVATFFR